MKLLRLAFVGMREIPAAWLSWSLTIESFSVKALRVYDSTPQKRLLLGAQTQIAEALTITEPNLIDIPPAPRRMAERAIEVVANLYAASTGEGRSITSPTPCIALRPETEFERSLLDRCTGYNTVRVGFPSGGMSFSLDQLFSYTRDRLDGLSLLAEALSHSHHTGRLHDLLRVFERAFRLSSSELVQPLSIFMKGAPLNVTQREVEDWLVRTRHPVTHADTHNDFLTEADVRKMTGRMQEAAYDVLLNKTIWRSPTTERRAAWRPSAGSSSPSGDIFITQGLSASLSWHFLDDFACYERDLQGFFGGPLPDGWWAKISHAETPAIGRQQ